MRCRVAICAACCTRLNGVNHCHACLKVLGGRRGEQAANPVGRVVLAALLLGMACLVLFALSWAVSGKMAP